jgi:hypothetical protein
MDLGKYIGKPIDTLLRDIPYPMLDILFYIGPKNCHVKSSYLVLSNNIEIKIFVESFQYMNPVNCRTEFNQILCRKENMADVSIYYKNQLVKSL